VSRVQIILLLAAGIMALESLWGLINPREIKETIGRLLPGMPRGSRAWEYSSFRWRCCSGWRFPAPRTCLHGFC